MSDIKERLKALVDGNLGGVLVPFFKESIEEFESLEADNKLLKAKVKDLAEYAEEQHTKWLDVKNHYAGTQLAIANGVNDDLKAKVKELELDVDSCKAMIKVILEDAALTTNKSDKG